MIVAATVMRNYGMNQNFADINPVRDFQHLMMRKILIFKPKLVEVKQHEIRER